MRSRPDFMKMLDGERSGEADKAVAHDPEREPLYKESRRTVPRKRRLPIFLSS